ncbi:MAG TPA: Ig-like domain-containing protein, partial [Anaerolineae bacterium]|nr:Ig-like domain-containing protein [Anaerolineae bacterium]
TSWFRRHIARAGELMGGARLFRPKDTVTDVDFLGWLRAVSKRRVEGALTGADPRDPIRLTRERAITATIRFIYGDGPVAALEACPPPASEIALGMKSDPAELWRQAFDGLPGSSNVTPALRPYLVLAHAKGLLYAEPSLHSKWPLTREVAAWLLSHAIDAVRTDTTGIIVDAIDVPLAPDLRFGMGEICFVQDGELMTKLYPRHATSDRLPSAAPGYPWVLYVSARALADTASREAQWMTQRVGRNPMVVRARGVDGRGTLARHVVISEADAERIIATNRTTGILDNYGVAIVHGVGAQLSTARRTSGGQQECLVVRFSVAMDPATVNTGSVRLEEVTSGRRVPTKLTWQPGKPVELQVEPATRLDPGRQYALVLADTVRSAGGLPLTMAGREGLPPGVARRWALNTEHGLSAPRSQNVAWARLFAAS